MASATGNTTPEYGIPGPSSQVDDDFTAQYMAPVGVLAPPIPNLVQFDQKKAPAFFNDPRRDPISIREWIKRIENMKTAQGWDEAQTYSNALGSLFGPAAQIMETQCDRRLNPDFAETWAWLKKALKKNFDTCATSRAYVDLIFAIRPQTSIDADLNASASKIYNDFKTIREVIPDTVVAAPGVGGYTQAQAQQLVDEEKLRVVDAFAYAFIVNTLPSEVRTKVLESKPETIAAALEQIMEIRQRMKDEKRPVHNTQANHGPKLNVASPENLETSMEDRICNMVMQRMGNFRPQNNSQGKKNNGKKKSGGGGQNSNSANNLPKKCNYCQKKGHGTIDCFKRKEDKAPCYNAKGEAFYPEGESPNKINEQTNPRGHIAVSTPDTQVPKGSDFHNWV